MIFFTVHFSILFWLVVFLNFFQGSMLSLNWLSLANLTGCGGELSGPTGSFSSPGYPNTYPPNKECLWYITTAPGSSIQLTIHDFDVEYHAMCNFDILEVGIQIAYQHVPSTPEFGVELEITLQNSLNYFQWPVVFYVQTFQQVSILCEWCWRRNGINNLSLGYPKSRVWRTWWQAIQLGDGTRKQAWGDSRRWGEGRRASEGAPEGHLGDSGPTGTLWGAIRTAHQTIPLRVWVWGTVPRLLSPMMDCTQDCYGPTCQSEKSPLGKTVGGVQSVEKGWPWWDGSCHWGIPMVQGAECGNTAWHFPQMMKMAFENLL